MGCAKARSRLFLLAVTIFFIYLSSRLYTKNSRHVLSHHFVEEQKYQTAAVQIHEQGSVPFSKFDLRINPNVRTDGNAVQVDSWLDRYVQLLSALSTVSRTNGSWVYRAYAMEQELRINPGEYNYNLYPQLIDLRRTVSAIKQGRAINRQPINDARMPILTAPSMFCHPQMSKEYASELVVAIKSCVRCFADRQSARATFMQKHLWGDFRIHFVFATGLPTANYTGQFHFNGVSVNYKSHGNNRDDVEDTREKLMEEARQFGDILIGDFADHYFSLTEKQSFIFRWIASFCAHESALYLFMDHDFAVVPQNLIRFVRNLPNRIRPDLSVGIRGQSHWVVRPSRSNSHGRWAVSMDEVPWPIFPSYFAGHAYMKGIRVVTDMAIASAFLPSMRVEDAHMGLSRFKLHIPTYSLRQFALRVKSAEELSTVVCVYAHYVNKYMNWTTGEIRIKS